MKSRCGKTQGCPVVGLCVREKVAATVKQGQVSGGRQDRG
jgi:hypothetical protein